MYAGTRFAFSLLAALAVSAAAAPRARAADDKSICLAAADQGQSTRDDGHYTLARDQFLTCARDVCPKIVHEQCAQWLRQLDDAMPTVVFAAKDAHGADVEAARVYADGTLVASALDGKPVSLDPGPHEIRFERDDGESTTAQVVLRSGEKNRAIGVTFPAPSGAAVAAAPPTPAAPAGESAPQASSSFWTARNVVPLALLVGAAAAAGVGAYFGVQSQNEKSSADSLLSGLGRSSCSQPITAAARPTCDALNSARDAQNSDALLNASLYVAAGALAVGAVASYLLWPKTASDQRSATVPGWTVLPAVGLDRTGLRFEARF